MQAPLFRIMSRWPSITVTGILFTLAFAFTRILDAGDNIHRFPDFNVNYVPPEHEYDGPLFRLSQEFPEERPELDRALRQILAIPYDQNAEASMQYLRAVRDYCFDGNLEVNWRGQENKQRTWYHVPWQHAGEKGREGINGLTREATAQPKQLAATQISKFQTHAVALYNPLGGYTIGKVWRNQFEPDATAARFPVGTVVVKVLFTQATKSEVPYLVNPISWKAYIHDPAMTTPPLTESTPRRVQDVQLLQMDIMVRDDRADAAGGWVFGTYCYNGSIAEKNPWKRLVPVGLQWGNDESRVDPADNPFNSEPTDTKPNDKLKQTFINYPSQDLPPQHLGWGGRLNGPADYYKSSCMSCHSTAQYPSTVQQHPDFEKPVRYKPGDEQWNAWFRNLPCGVPFSPVSSTDKRRAISTDYSLQLSIGISQFYAWKSKVMGGFFTPLLPNAPRPDVRVDVSIPTSEPPSAPQ